MFPLKVRITPIKACQELIVEAGDVSSIQDEIVVFVEENPDVIETDISELIQEIPTGTWDEYLTMVPPSQDNVKIL